MKALLLLVLVFGMLTAPGAPSSLADTIRAARWKKRVLLVVAPTAGHADFQQQKQLLSAAASQLQDRDLLVLEVLHSQLTPTDRQYLQREAGLKLTGFEVVLIGKDGEVKERSTRPLSPAALFSTIDKMPMRRQEMRQRR